MASTMLLALCMFALGLPLALGQPFTLSPRQFATGVTEARQRQNDNYTGFVYNFNSGPTSDLTPNGMLQPNQVNTNPYLGTLPGDGNGQTLISMGPCAGNTPHTHPRGSEISFMLYGSVTFGLVEENSVNNTLVIRNITQNSTIHIPQGVLHFSHNYNCEPAAFLANFATEDPGTQTTWASLMQVPNSILHMATGIPEATFQSLKTDYPLVTAPGTGGEECLRRCGLNFTQANHLTPISQFPPANTGTPSMSSSSSSASAPSMVSSSSTMASTPSMAAGPSMGASG